MKIAIPVHDNQLCQHFGHCDTFRVFDIDNATKTITQTSDLTPPPHEPGVLPVWLKNQEVTLLIAGGMGARAQQLLESHGIAQIIGAPSLPPEELIELYLNENLKTGTNACDH